MTIIKLPDTIDFLDTIGLENGHILIYCESLKQNKEDVISNLSVDELLKILKIRIEEEKEEFKDQVLEDSMYDDEE